MATVDVLDVSGMKAGDARARRPTLFEATVSVPLMHQVVVAGLAASRRARTRPRPAARSAAAARSRGARRAPAAPGRARSARRSGSAAASRTGRTRATTTMRVNKKMKRGRAALGAHRRAQSGKLAVVDELAFDEPKTKRGASRLLDALELDGQGALVLPEPPGRVEKSFRNLRNVRVAYAREPGGLRAPGADRVLFTAAALDTLNAREAAA